MKSEINTPMKSGISLSLAVLMLLLVLPGCKKDNPLTPNKETEKLLIEKSWTLNSVQIDGVYSSLYAGLTLKFTTTNYSTTNGGALWPASGTWTFEGDMGDKILRDDGLQITIESISASQLIIVFTWTKTTSSGGRTASLKGGHRMVFDGK